MHSPPPPPPQPPLPPLPRKSARPGRRRRRLRVWEKRAEIRPPSIARRVSPSAFYPIGRWVSSRTVGSYACTPAVRIWSVYVCTGAGAESICGQRYAAAELRVFFRIKVFRKYFYFYFIYSNKSNLFFYFFIFRVYYKNTVYKDKKASGPVRHYDGH